jgi:hypothetical protein
MRTMQGAGSAKTDLERRHGRDSEESCPVCGKDGTRSSLSRHVMASSDTGHKAFVEVQDLGILDLFDHMDAGAFSVVALALSPGIFCSPAHVRKLLSQHRLEWKDKARVHRTIDTAKQHADGRRKKVGMFANGWKASKELGTGNYMPRWKRDAIIGAFGSDKTINCVARSIGCKNGTVAKIWREEFSETEYEARINRTWRFLKPSPDLETGIRALFLSDESRNEVAKRFGTSPDHVERIWKHDFGKEAYDARCARMRKLGISKSWDAMGRMTSSGQGSQPEFACFQGLVRIFGSETIHHDTDSLPPYELDVSVPGRRMAVLWDGPSHRKPIFGDKALAKVAERDRRKRQLLAEGGWIVVVVEDDCRKFRYIDMEAIVSRIAPLDSPGIHRIAVGEHGELE